MADPLSGLAAVGVVANIINLLEFTGKVAQHTFRILRSASGTLKESERLETLVAEQARLSAGIGGDENQSWSLNKEEFELDCLANRCKTEAEQLLQQIADLKLDDQTRGVKRTWQGARKATKAVAGKREMETKFQHISELNKQISSRLLVMLKTNLAEIHSSFLKEVESSRKDTLHAILESKKDILTAIEEQQKEMRAKEAAERNRKANSILDSLRFADMTLRRGNIQDSYPKTYEWILKRGKPCTLRCWLESGTGLFWVSGKAGSGKSTLMKFLARHTETKEALRTWAKSNDLIIAEFYFWYLGSAMQKSIQGLLQSMLYQIIHQCPNLAPILCPGRWHDLDTFENQLSWTESELYEAIRMAATASLLDTESSLPSFTSGESTAVRNEPASAHDQRTREYRFFFFIDGLDEYTGDQLQLATSIKNWAMSPRFKICAASRPWNVFNTAFKEIQNSLCLEDLTKRDIMHYVTSKLSPASNKILGVEMISKSDPTTAKLILSVVGRAHGVFLWVFLVVNSVRRGLAEGDSIKTLLRRVEAFPSDLYEYFKLIFDRVDEIYARQTAQALLLAANIADRNTKDDQLAANFLTYWLLRRGEGDLDTALQGDDARHTISDLIEMKSETQRFLSACCKDLLCVSRLSLRIEENQADRMFQVYKDWISPQKVEFLHRTVYEFIKSDFLQSLLSKHSPASMYQPDFYERLALVRLRLIPHGIPRGVWCFCSYFYDQAMQICGAIGASASCMAQELDRLGQYWLRLGCPGQCTHHKGLSNAAAILYSTLASHGLFNTLNAAMESSSWNPYLCNSSQTKESLLQIVLGLGYVEQDIGICASGFALDKVDRSVLARLLDRGASPNEEYKGMGYREFHQSRGSVWQAFLNKWLRSAQSSSPTLAKRQSGCDDAAFPAADRIVREASALLIKHEANIQVKVLHPVKGLVSAEVALAELDPSWNSERNWEFD